MPRAKDLLAQRTAYAALAIADSVAAGRSGSHGPTPALRPQAGA